MLPGRSLLRVSGLCVVGAKGVENGRSRATLVARV
jgi:hypothetical protein